MVIWPSMYLKAPHQIVGDKWGSLLLSSWPKCDHIASRPPRVVGLQRRKKVELHHPFVAMMIAAAVAVLGTHCESLVEQ